MTPSTYERLRVRYHEAQRELARLHPLAGDAAFIRARARRDAFLEATLIAQEVPDVQ